jgi:hypothetical protein
LAGAEHWQSRYDPPLVAKPADLAMIYIYRSLRSEGT